MKLRITELVLFSINEVLSDRKEFDDIERDELASALSVSESSLGVYLSKLASDSLVIRRKRHFRNEINRTVSITDKGRETASKIRGRMEEFRFTPEDHNTQSIIPFTDIFDRTLNVLERIFLLNVYVRLPRFDLGDLRINLSSGRHSNGIEGYLLRREAGHDPLKPYYADVFRSTLYGYSSMDLNGHESMTLDDANSLIMFSESLRKRGKIERAFTTIGMVLDGMPITQNQWILANIELAQIHMKNGEYDVALNRLDQMEEKISDRLYLATIGNMKAKVMVHMDRFDEANALMTRAINSFREQNVPLLMCIALTNRGVVSFINGNTNRAQKDWRNAQRIAMDNGLDYVKSLIDLNIADLEMKSGNTEKAKNLLDGAWRTLYDMGDLEGLSTVEFNRCLLEITMGNGEKAKDHLVRSETIAYPLPDPWSRRVKREEVLKRADEQGIKGMESFIKGLKNS